MAFVVCVSHIVHYQIETMCGFVSIVPYASAMLKKRLFWKHGAEARAKRNKYR